MVIIIKHNFNKLQLFLLSLTLLYYYPYYTFVLIGYSLYYSMLFYSTLYCIFCIQYLEYYSSIV